MAGIHISELIERVKARKKSCLQLSSLTAVGLALAEVERACSGPWITLVPNLEAAEELQKSFSAISTLNTREVLIWPSWDSSPFSPVSSSLLQRNARLKILKKLALPHARIWIVATAESWAQPTLGHSDYLQLCSALLLAVGAQLKSRDELLENLRNLGYVRSDLVQESGQFAIRGEILDIFITGEPAPHRVEFFDVEIEKIRIFNPESQRILASDVIHELPITPAEEALFPWGTRDLVLEKIKIECDGRAITRKIRDPIFENIRQGYLPENFRTWLPWLRPEIGTLQDHLPPNTIISVIDPELCESKLRQHQQDLENDFNRYQDEHWITPRHQELYPFTLNEYLKQFCGQSLITFQTGDTLHYEILPPTKISMKKIASLAEDGYRIWIGSRGVSQRERLQLLLKEENILSGVSIMHHHPAESIAFYIEKLMILQESHILGRGHFTDVPTPARNTNATQYSDFQAAPDLNVGDFVVHDLHGIGKYLGLLELKSAGRPIGEYLCLEYANADKLYLPIYRLNVIQRHTGSEGLPPLDKLGTPHFEKAKQKARDSAKKLAINLLEIYAKRALSRGQVFSADSEAYDEFCDQFPFIETEGQARATQDTLRDLSTGKLLDRLICGDVGFGKTEVAMRAAFQAVQSGYQVAVLVPTTLLAFQHEQTFRSRMKSFPITIESLSRFKTKKEQNAIIKRMGAGTIDILIGTHRLLSKDMTWSRLGLLIVDEEHRFGVEQKEKIKALQVNTHTLTLTATPIPRTLNMALSRIKDISMIKTPPTNRQPIKTYTARKSDELIRTAIETELSRGGQVFFLYNRVKSIDKQAKEIQALVPNAKVITAHGQMSEEEIEEKMLQFYQGHAQVLVCTTIIESGIDVPNAGTILIHRADQLGLAQLYQIRGRVGRSHRKAHAYLLVDEERTLTQDARLRLDALQRFVELGSGFHIAAQDLEIRGGGNLLGGEQSGHIASVGMDYFTEMLENAIRELRGQKQDENHQLEPEIQLPVLAEIPSSLVPEAQLRLSFYRRLSRARTNAEVDVLAEEFLERFGSVPEEVHNLLWLIRMKIILKLLGIESLVATAEKTTLTARKSSLIDPDEVLKLYSGPKGVRDPRVQLLPDSRIAIKIPFKAVREHLLALEPFFRQFAPKAFEIIERDG